MPVSRLQDDLLREFRDEKRMIAMQIEEFNPLALQLRKPAAQRLASAGLILFGELLCWALALSSVVTAIFLKKLYPFYELFQPRVVKEGEPDFVYLQWIVYGMLGLIAILFLMLARSLARIRLKNSILNLAGARIKTLVGQHLERKAAIEAIEQRHFNELPADMPISVNEVPNPGYDDVI